MFLETFVLWNIFKSSNSKNRLFYVWKNNRRLILYKFVWNLVLLTTKRNSSNFYNTEVSVKIWILNSWKISLWKTSIFCGRIQCWLQFYKIQRNPGKSKIWSSQKLYYLNCTIWVSKVLYRFDIYKRPFINDITPEVEGGVQKRKFWAILKA